MTCNQPTSTTDELGNVTDYTYDPVHGGVLTVTAPAASPGGVRPKVTNSYAQLYAWYKNASGTLVQAPSPVWKLVSSSTCATIANCAGTADEVKTTYSYGTPGTPNNLLLTSVTTASGTGAVSSTVTYAYDAIGNKISEDGPLPGSADTTLTMYDVMRRPIQVVSPDPDGAGPLKNRSVKTSYNANGQVLAVQSGTSNADGSGFVELTRTDTGYDQYLRKIKQTVTTGGTITARTDYSYDALDRPECVAVRMNPAVFATSTTGACTLGTEGSYGPDRITRTTYDAYHRVASVQTGYGTSLQRTEKNLTYTNDHLPATLTDARGNKTTYEYDGVDRLVKTRFPSPTSAGTSSTTDYEQLTYDAKSQVTQRRLRDGKQIAYSYDNLGRQTLAHPVNPVDANDVDQGASYDLLGRRLSATDAGGRGVSYTYDALGRVLSETPALTAGAATMQYDAAGRRTRLTWSDGFYVTYDYDVLGEMIAVRENGATSGTGVLATFAYDDQGRRVSLTRGNGVVDSYGYDTAGRLASLANNHASAGNTFGYGYNPAGQLTSRTMTNAAYAWSGAVPVNRAYTVNGLNQYTASGAIVPTYDGRGNLTSAGATAYIYDSRNRLTTFGTTTLLYDGLGRLASQSSPGTRFVQQGSDLIAETNGSNMITRRYVHGPGTDEVLAWYEGTGVNEKRWLSRDERGSSTLITDASGTALRINSYDEYGIPSATNLGRFQYTGQTWLPELGMYYYKARIYSATLGRFLQTDPTGYDDGPNWYNYAHGDPVNGTDPTGKSFWGSIRNFFEHLLDGTNYANTDLGDSSIESGPDGPLGPTSVVTASINCSTHTSAPECGGTRVEAEQNGNLPGIGHNGGPPIEAAEPEIVITGTRVIGSLLARLSVVGGMVYQAFNDPACCFTAGTQVSTPTGLKAIEILKVGDLVMSRSDQTGQTIAKPIVSITPAHERRIWAVTISYKGNDGRWRDEHYETTEDHPWRTADRHWVVSALLKHGQLLARRRGTAIVVSVVDTKRSKQTYNLEVVDFHTYFVGKAETWVHNSCNPYGIPDNYTQQPGRKDGHVKYVNPNNSHDFVRVKPDGTITQVRNGMAYDAYGNRVPTNSSAAHGITPDQFIFRY